MEWSDDAIVLSARAHGENAVVLELLTNYGVGGVTGAVSGMYIVVTLLMIFVGIDTNRSLEAIEPRASA